MAVGIKAATVDLEIDVVVSYYRLNLCDSFCRKGSRSFFINQFLV